MLRDTEVQWPWHDQSGEAIRHLPPRLSAAELHPALLGIVMQPERYGDAARTALGACTADNWNAALSSALIFTHPQEPSHRPAPAIAAAMARAQTARRPDKLNEAALAARAFLESLPA
jgi:hypothetical protein